MIALATCSFKTLIFILTNMSRYQESHPIKISTLRKRHTKISGNLRTQDKCIRNQPAIQAVRKQATFPHIIALTTIFARSGFLVGASAPIPPSVIPMEPKFANPHKAYVAMISDFT